MIDPTTKASAQLISLLAGCIVLGFYIGVGPAIGILLVGWALLPYVS